MSALSRALAPAGPVRGGSTEEVARNQEESMRGGEVHPGDVTKPTGSRGRPPTGGSTGGHVMMGGFPDPIPAHTRYQFPSVLPRPARAAAAGFPKAGDRCRRPHSAFRFDPAHLRGQGSYVVAVLVDGELLDRATVSLTNLGQEFSRGVSGRYVLEDFPNPGESVVTEWEESLQNFVITERR